MPDDADRRPDELPISMSKTGSFAPPPVSVAPISASGRVRRLSHETDGRLFSEPYPAPTILRARPIRQIKQELFTYMPSCRIEVSAWELRVADTVVLRTAVDTAWSIYRATHHGIDRADDRRCLL
jgi:hypothetical protein